MEVLENIKNSTTICCSGSISEYLSEENKTLFWKVLCILVFIASLFNTASVWKQHSCSSVDDWLKEWWYIYYIQWNITHHKNE